MTGVRKSRRNKLPFWCSVPLAALLLSAVGTAAFAEAPEFSWGKAGVSYEQFSADVGECGSLGLATNLENSEPVEVLRRATRDMERLDSTFSTANAGAPAATGSGVPADVISRAQDMDSVRASARPSQQIERIKVIMFETIRTCLMDRGYVRFALTESQRSEYDALSGGRDERLAYMLSLASDPAVLESQQQPL